MFFFTAAFVFSLWAATVGWKNGNLRGVEFRQAQTALSTYFIQKEDNYSLAYPTPVLGKPWSIPMEFPLYQWTVARVSTMTGLALTPTARVVSLLCFYLTLPAVFLLLGEWHLSVRRRWLVLGLVVSSPLYIFYGRAFLMETMAFMLSVWFLLGYLRWLKTARWGWLITAVVFGVGAGLVKVTTFMLYLVPAASGTLVLLWQNRPTAAQPGWSRAGRIGLFSAAAVTVPFIATFWWMHFADITKALNPRGEFLVSSNMNGYHFGTSATRFASKIWAGHWRILSESVIGWPLVVLAGVGLAFVWRQCWAKVFFCLACFGGIQLLLPELYAWHDYYYVANTLFLLVAIGLVLTALLDSRLPRWMVGMVMVGALAGQVVFYAQQFFPAQSAISPEGSDLTRMLKEITGPEDVLLIQGEDWNSMIPYYARRRALMLRTGADKNEAELLRAFANLKGEKVGVLVTTGILDKQEPLLKLVVEQFGFNSRPVLKWKDKFIYFPDERWDEVYEKFETTPFHEVNIVPGGQLVDDPLAGRWFEVKKVRRYQLGPLKYMQPRPVSFFVRFGLSLNGTNDAPQFGAHPETRLRFVVPAGARHLKTSAGLSPGAYENLPADEASDGIDVTVTLLQPGIPDQVLYSRNLNPRENQGDRGAVPINVDFAMPSSGELELSVTSGPNQSDRRDWAFLGQVVID